MSCVPRNNKSDHIYKAILLKLHVHGSIKWETQCDILSRPILVDQYQVLINLDGVIFHCVGTIDQVFRNLVNIALDSGSFLSTHDLSTKFISLTYSNMVCVDLLSSVFNKTYFNGLSTKFGTFTRFRVVFDEIGELVYNEFGELVVWS